MKNIKYKTLALTLSLFVSLPAFAEVTQADLDALQKKREEVFGDKVKSDDIPEKKKPASICYSETKKKAENFLNNLIPNVCGNINTTTDPSNSKFAYENPDGGCDIGLEMPGLPSFGGSFSGISSCQIVKAVTGDMVDKVNDTVNGAWDGAINMAKDKIREKTGLDADNLNFDMGQIAEDAISGESMTKSFTSD